MVENVESGLISAKLIFSAINPLPNILTSIPPKASSWRNSRPNTSTPVPVGGPVWTSNGTSNFSGPVSVEFSDTEYIPAINVVISAAIVPLMIWFPMFSGSFITLTPVIGTALRGPPVIVISVNVNGKF